MADFTAVTASNDPKVKDQDAVEVVIARYYFDPDLNIGVGIDPDNGNPRLCVYGDVWPEAWKLPEGMHPDDFDPYDNDQYEQGADGFVELLKELSPLLLEPLTVQAVGSTKCRFPLSACEWYVEPNATDVHFTDFQHSCSTVEAE